MDRFDIILKSCSNRNQMVTKFSEERKLLEYDLPGFKPEEVEVKIRFFNDGKDVIYINAVNEHRPPVRHTVPIYGYHIDKENVRCKLELGVLTIYGRVCSCDSLARVTNDLIVSL